MSPAHPSSPFVGICVTLLEMIGELGFFTSAGMGTMTGTGSGAGATETGKGGGMLGHCLCPHQRTGIFYYYYVIIIEGSAAVRHDQNN